MERVSGSYRYTKVPGISFSKDDPRAVSRTQQHFKKESDINVIMARARKTGILVDPLLVNGRLPVFADFTQVGDFHSVQDRLLAVKEYFMRLPAKVRERFKGDPGNLLKFINDPSNLKEAMDLGLINRKVDKVRYVDKSGNDITDKVLSERGIKKDGRVVDKDGVPADSKVTKKEDELSQK